MNVGLQSKLLAVCPNSTLRLERTRELQRTTATHFAERQVSGAADMGSVDLTGSNQSRLCENSSLNRSCARTTRQIGSGSTIVFSSRVRGPLKFRNGPVFTRLSLWLTVALT